MAAHPASVVHYSKLRFRWSLPCASINLESTDDVLHRLLEFGVVALPAGEVGGKTAGVSIIGNLGRVLLYLDTTLGPETDIESDRRRDVPAAFIVG